MNHTPGPWKLETVKTACGICHKIGPFPYYTTRNNHACVYVDNGNHEFHDELKANAHLIAASPDMLAALEAIRACAIVAKYPEDRKAFFESTKMVEAAIAKARGEA